MKNLFIFFSLLSINMISFNQIQFERIIPSPPSPQNIINFIGASSGDVVFGDINNDNNVDAIIIGLSGPTKTSNIYLGDGLGNFQVISNNNLPTFTNGDIELADLDNDNDLDLFITGDYSTKLYLNDGNANFTLSNIANFENIGLSSSTVFDCNGDGWLDIFITGKKNTNQRISYLYNNNGNGTFSLSTNSFEGLAEGDVDHGDIDNDGDIDLIITGRNSSNSTVSKIYTNNGFGTYSFLNTSISGVRSGAVAFSDIDNDNDLDLLISGRNSSSLTITKLYKNDGNGNFSNVLNTPFENITDDDFAFMDIDNDNDNDLIITGTSTHVYTNNGFGNFTNYTSPDFEYVNLSSVDFSDIDNDGDFDLLIIGENLNDGHTANLYINDGTGYFSVVKKSPYEGVHFGEINIADIDADNDLDIFISGMSYNGNIIAKIYKNDGFGNFSLDLSNNFTGVYKSSSKFIDIDNDNDLDLIVSGRNTPNQKNTSLYTNDGNGNFTIVSGTTFIGVSDGDIEVGDLDNDGDADLLFIGESNSNQGIAKIYLNDGNGNFSLLNGNNLEGVTKSDADFSDVDNDNDLDVIITGKNNSNQSIAKLYLNNGNAIFTLHSSFAPVFEGTVTFQDVDNDNDDDVLITGWSYSPSSAKLYKNDGLGNFSATASPFQSVRNSSVTFFDMDNDNDKDILITGQDGVNLDRTTYLYSNNGNGFYSMVSNVNFERVMDGDAACADFNNDTKNDIILIGSNQTILPIFYLYKNTSCLNTIYTDTQISCSNNFTWIDGNTYSSPNNVAQIVLTDANGCDSTVVLDLSFNQIDTTINLNGVTLISNQSNSLYQWVDCNNGFNPIIGETDSSFTPFSNGKYACIINNGSCVDTSECITILNVGLEKNSFIEDSFIMYPNPTKNYITIKTNNNPIKTIIIYDNLGKIILQKEINEKEITINLKSFSNGLYFLHVKNNLNSSVIKLIKN